MSNHPIGYIVGMAQPETLFDALMRFTRGEHSLFRIALPSGRAEARAPGVIALIPDTAIRNSASTLISVGIHGDETAPIELLGQIASELDRGAFHLGAPALLVVGHPSAIVNRTRYLDTNLNRLFGGENEVLSGETREHRRASELMAAVDAFWNDALSEDIQSEEGVALHLDLHTTIRASHYPRFAVEPFSKTPTPDAIWRELSAADIQAVLSQNTHSWTFSHYSRYYHQICGLTLELGRVAPFGNNDLAALMPFKRFLVSRLAGQSPAHASAGRITYFRMFSEVKRYGPDFELTLDHEAPNFTRFEPGQLIAQDPGYGDTYIEDEPAYVVFPNAKVERGARAALLARTSVPPHNHVSDVADLQ